MNQIPQNSELEYITPVYRKVLWALLSGFLELTSIGQSLSLFLLKITQKKYKRIMALKVLSLSTHYFIYQWSNKYAKSVKRRDILEAEHKRNIDSRKEICDQLVKKYLEPDMTALDFGCGPGYITHHVAAHVNKLIGIDVSRTAISCARELNNAPNIEYYTVKEENIENSSIDLIYSFAVIQHIKDDTFEQILKEFHRILKSGGKVICHIPLEENGITKIDQKKHFLVVRYFRNKLMPPMTYRREDDVREKLRAANFSEPTVTMINKISSIRDDIGTQHLFVFDKN